MDLVKIIGEVKSITKDKYELPPVISKKSLIKFLDNVIFREENPVKFVLATKKNRQPAKSRMDLIPKPEPKENPIIKQTIDRIKKYFEFRNKTYNVVSTLDDFDFKLIVKKTKNEENYTIGGVINPKKYLENKEKGFKETYNEYSFVFDDAFKTRKEAMNVIKDTKQAIKNIKL
jgi:hypothetical protein